MTKRMRPVPFLGEAERKRLTDVVAPPMVATTAVGQQRLDAMNDLLADTRKRAEDDGWRKGYIFGSVVTGLGIVVVLVLAAITAWIVL